MRKYEARCRRHAALGLMLAALALAGCTDHEALRKKEMTNLAVLLPGTYDNARQTLTILRVPAPLIGDRVFYVRETAAGDARRVISERVWSLEALSDSSTAVTVYRIAEPDRWHSAVEDPEMFRSMLTGDLHPVDGCALVWQKTAQGYKGAAVSPRCPQRWRIEGDELAFSDHADTAGGADAFFHFHRRSGEQPAEAP
jgi:CpeT/CpcT family (DUF1001)